MIFRHLIACAAGIALIAATLCGQTTRPAAVLPDQVGEAVPSEDPIIPDLHSMGLIDGHTNIFRSGCPVRDIAKRMSTTQPSDAELEAAVAQMQRLADLGIGTVISFQDPLVMTHDGKDSEVPAACALESAAARKVGIRYISAPIANSGANSLQTMSDADVMRLLDERSAQILAAARQGGVVFHCSAGHDRTGIIAAYLRMKYEHWPVEQAIAEMRRMGHNWPKYSADGGASSWHETHLRAIAELLAAPAAQSAATAAP